MDNFTIASLLAVLAGITIISYKGYAEQKGWPIGSLFESGANWLSLVALLALLGGTVELFIQLKWYWAIGGLVGSWLASGAITGVFAKHTQIVSIFILITSLVIWIYEGIEYVAL